jgi:hypothetical protein
MATLNLPIGGRVAVWRLVKAAIQADPILQAAEIAQVFFDGSSDRTALQSPDNVTGPTVFWLATLGRMSWFNEQSQSGALVISYQVVIPSTDDEDLLNVQEAIEAVFYPADNFVFHQSLINASAVTGEALFAQPLTAPIATAGSSGLLKPSGQIVLEVIRPLGP